MLLIEELYRPLISIEGKHCRRVILVPDDTLPIIVGFDRDSDLLGDEITDAFATSTTFFETVCVNLQRGRFELGNVGVVVVMKICVDIPVTARVKRVLEKVANKGDV